MIYRLRKKFIRICMCSFLAVFVVLFGAIFTLTSLQTTHALDDLANIMQKTMVAFPATTVSLRDRLVRRSASHRNRRSPHAFSPCASTPMAQ